MRSWYKSSKCESSMCVEVSIDGECVLVRSTERPDHVVRFTHEEWRTFLAGVKANEFNP